MFISAETFPCRASRSYGMKSNIRPLQGEPTRCDDRHNLYAYVANDPVNFADPFGNKKVCVQEPGSRISRCANVNDEDEDGDVDSADRNAVEAWLRFQFANPDIFVHNSQEMTEFRLASIERGERMSQTGIYYYQDTAMTRAMDRDAQALLTGRISEAEYWNRANARGIGVIAGFATLVLVRGAGYAVGPGGPLFGNTFYRGMGNSGFFNHGAARIGWSFNGQTGMLEFTLRVGGTHYRPVIVMRPPPR